MKTNVLERRSRSLNHRNEVRLSGATRVERNHAQVIVLAAVSRALEVTQSGVPLVSVAAATNASDIGDSLIDSSIKKAVVIKAADGSLHSTLTKGGYRPTRMADDESLVLDEALFHDAMRPWSKRDDISKIIPVALAMNRKTSWAFSVNFSHRRMVAIDSNPGFAIRALRNECARLSKWGPSMFVVERSSSGRLHLHGLIDTCETEASKEDLRGALLALGLPSTNIAFRNLKQVGVRNAVQPMSYALYMLKDVGEGLNIPNHGVYISDGARVLGRTALEKIRANCRSLGLRIDARGRPAKDVTRFAQAA